MQIIADARKQAGLTQLEFAEKLGRSQSYVSNIERGQRRVDLLEFYAICVVLQLDPVEMFRETVRRIEAYRSSQQVTAWRA
ncbi:helix-turn-helix transcriptional regulator [Sphingomonas sp. HITSZ_GF]|uniref:helix-turn-helix domain-containing protein n=1 Tax=Sphingomonas sp. HITSZ_GF TaxID=3037247 RepID=UPI00240E4574|nr:helix-turn-helix transcriptional regulator [Sphingomonas sp. HITSZ_GF]MDG2532751.1 helix-turn-helix transcriptional regulator [Sphingomonas sp. HITSZ_GF]